MQKITWQDHVRYWHRCQGMLEEERQTKDCPDISKVDELIRDAKAVRRRIELLKDKEVEDPLEVWVKFKEYAEGVKKKIGDFFKYHNRLDY